MFAGTQHGDETTTFFFLLSMLRFIKVVLVRDTLRFACMKGAPMYKESFVYELISLEYRHLQNGVVSVYQFVTKSSHRLNVNGTDLETPV